MSTETIVKKKYTIEEFLDLPGDVKKYELVNGELREKMPAGEEHCRIGNRLNIYLGSYILQNKLGETYGADAGFTIDRQNATVRMPDIAFVTKERLVRTKKVMDFTPDLAVEVISPNDSNPEVKEKVDSYRQAGILLIWVIDPDKQTIEVYRANTPEKEVLDLNAELDGENIVPGFKLKISLLFE